MNTFNMGTRVLGDATAVPELAVRAQCPALALKPAMAPYCHQSKSDPIFGVWVLQRPALLRLFCPFLSA